MIKYLIFLLHILIALFLYFELTIYRTKKLFIKLTAKLSRPACIINNSTRKIIWKNSSFTNQFPSIAKNNNFATLNPNLFFDKLKINEGGIDWILENFDLETNCGIILYPIEKIDPYIFLDLPFAIVILDKNNKIKQTNKKFEELIAIEHYKKDISLFNIIITQSSCSEDLIWHTKEGLQPIKTSVKTFNNKTIIFLENNLDNIKLKRRAQESQQLQILGQLTSSIIHDFKNLLTSICGFTDSLAEEIPNDPSLKSIQQNIEQASNLVQELLNFIKEKPVEDEIIEPKIALQKISNIIKTLLGSKIKLVTNINTDGYIKISNTQLERILFNMVLNSKEAMQNGGIFKINTRKEIFKTPYIYNENRSLNPGAYYVIEISDTGNGIKNEDFNKIFTPFFTTKSTGTGLGLASSLSLAEHCGGGITFTSSPQCTTFFIILPYLKNNIEKEEVKDNSKINKTPTKCSKIIVVEDEEMIKNIIKKAFVQEGFDVIDFDNGSLALKEIEKMEFDCLITDAILPCVDGTELANTAHRLKPEAKIFLVSGYDFEVLKKNLTAQVEYISKPFTIKTLKAQVLKSISR